MSLNKTTTAALKITGILLLVIGLFFLINILSVKIQQKRNTTISSKEQLSKVLKIDINDNVVVDKLEVSYQKGTSLYIRFHVDKNYLEKSEFRFDSSAKRAPLSAAGEFLNTQGKDLLESDIEKIDYQKWMPSDYVVAKSVLGADYYPCNVYIFVEKEDPKNECVNVYCLGSVSGKLTVNVKDILAEK